MKIRRLLALLLMLLALPVCASAEPEVAQDHVELYAEGALPSAPQSRAATFAATNIQSTLVNGLSNQQSEIDVSGFGLTPNAFKQIYRDVLNAHPEFFYVEGGFRYSYSGNTVLSVMPQYRYSGADLNRRIKAFNSAVNRIVSDANLASTTLGKLLRVNEYFCVNFQYDLSYSNYRPDELFSQGKGVCQAYMLGVRAVLNKLGIPNATVVSSPMNHTWNLVQLGGSWYHLDVTWNDPVPDWPLCAFHDNFLRSDEGIAATRHHDWEKTHSASSTRYDDAFWIDLIMPLSAVDDAIFFTEIDDRSRQFTINAWREDSGVSPVLTYTPSDAPGNYYGLGLGEPVCADASRIYYAVWDKVYSVSRTGGERRLEYAIGDAAQCIWRMVLDGRTMRLFASANHSPVDGTIYTVELGGLSLSLAPQAVHLTPGSSAQVTATLSPEPANPPALTYSSSCPAVAAVDNRGLITAALPGRAVITAAYTDDIAATCEVLVRCEHTLVLPDSLTRVGDEAFTGTAAQQIILPEGVLSIGDGAFAGSDALRYVNLPDSLSDIGAGAFADCPHLTLLCTPGSVGAAYAERQGIEHAFPSAADSPSDESSQGAE